MPLPDLTGLQFAAIACLLDGEMSGRKLRAAMKKAKVPMNPPAFYRLMLRLEEADLASGRFKNKTVGAQTVRERLYKITIDGQAALRQAEQFFATKNFAFCRAYAVE